MQRAGRLLPPPRQCDENMSGDFHLHAGNPHFGSVCTLGHFHTKTDSWAAIFGYSLRYMRKLGALTLTNLKGALGETAFLRISFHRHTFDQVTQNLGL